MVFIDLPEVVSIAFIEFSMGSTKFSIHNIGLNSCWFRDYLGLLLELFGVGLLFV